MLTRTQLTKWTDYLRKYPEKQSTDYLSNQDGTKQCCLGALCEVMEYPYKTSCLLRIYYGQEQSLAEKALQDFGSEEGYFATLKMPDLKWSDEIFCSAASANDAGVPWSVIADHFDKYYPCSDEEHVEISDTIRYS